MAKPIKNNQNCKFDNCRYNNETTFAHPGWFCFLYSISALTFGLGIEATQNFKVAAFLLSAPLLFNYIGFIPDKTEKGKYKLWIAEVSLSLAFLIFTVLMLIGILDVTYSNSETTLIVFNDRLPTVGGWNFNANYVWYYSLFMILFPAINTKVANNDKIDAAISYSERKIGESA